MKFDLKFKIYELKVGEDPVIAPMVNIACFTA